MILSEGLLYVAFIMLGYFPSIPILWSVFIIDGCCILSDIEAITLKDSTVICIWKIGSWLIVIKIVEKIMLLLHTKLFVLSNVDWLRVKCNIVWMGLLIIVSLQRSQSLECSYITKVNSGTDSVFQETFDTCCNFLFNFYCQIFFHLLSHPKVFKLC